MAAPLAQFDEDWQDFNEFKEVPNRLDQINSNLVDTSGLDDFSDLDNSFSGEICSFKSMEDLVNDFDQKLTVCFRNYNTSTENIAPVKPITEENFLKDDEIWNALTDNYGNVMPVDWSTSHTRSLHLPTLNLREQEKQDSLNIDLSDDEELREQLDMHNIIVSVTEEPLITAEQVIEEIEEMMQESVDGEDDDDDDDDESPSQSDLSTRSFTHSSSTNSYEERLRCLCVSELREELEEVECSIRRLSEDLIGQLALRDELEFEKEVKNSFISVLIDVQNRQKEHRERLRKKRKMKSSTGGQKTDRTHVPGTYLTTVIPYENKAGAPSVEDLQILTKILNAMREDSDRVPSLLTDYILKVLCPT
ncbi:fasciculation and elongation protein zeta-2 [Chanos chanos]|uniref:Fasciculation and elongation protein zeta-2 n=1 Tax=Chanos chanos TaxID=29144 RepID=A0A6J2W2A0_CHACN|nr:fasciculation and elongation protein zeta-2-like [Chanos chanos]